MSFYGNSEKRAYVSLHGKSDGGKLADILQWKIKDGTAEHYADTIGPVRVTGVQFREAKDKSFKNQYLVMLKSRDGKAVQMQLSEGSNYTNGVLNALQSVEPQQWVKFFCKFGANKNDPNNPYYNVYVLDTGDQWVKGPLTQEQVPKIEMVQVGDQQVKNDFNRRMFFKKIAESLSVKFSGNVMETSSEEAPKPFTEEEREQRMRDMFGAAPAPAAPAGMGVSAPQTDDDDLPF